MMERVKAMVVRIAETKKHDPTHIVSPRPGTKQILNNIFLLLSLVILKSDFTFGALS